MSSRIKPLSIHEARGVIAALRHINLKLADIEFLKQLLEFMLRGYVLATPVLMPDQRLFRGVKWSAAPTKIVDVSYPKPEYVAKFQRANRPHDPRFYCSVGAPAVVFELHPSVGCRIAISEWYVKEKLWVLNVGYHPSALSKMGVKRSATWWQKRPIPEKKPVNKLIHKFLADEFTRDVPDGEEHLYMLSAAIAEKLSGNIQVPEVAADMPKGTRFAGLQYPSLAMCGDADNFALLPNFVDSCVKLRNVRYVNVDEVSGRTSFQVTTIDFADTFSVSGDIQWWSKSCGIPEGNKTIRVALEGGRWVSRDPNGNIIQT